MTDTIGFRLEIAGAEQVAAGFDKVTSAVKASEAEAQKAATTTKALGEENERAAPKIQQFGSLIGLAGRGVSEMNPHLGQMVSTLGSATGAMGAMEAALGPLGIALAAATTAYTLIQQAVSMYQEKQQRLVDEIRNNAVPAFDQLLGRINAAQSAYDREQRLGRGGGTDAEYQARYQQESAYLQLVERRQQLAARDAFGGDPAAVARVREFGEEIHRVRENLQRIDDIRQHAATLRGAESAIPEAGPAPGSGGSSGSAGRRGGAGRGGSARDTGSIMDDINVQSHAGETTLNVSGENDRNAAKEMQHLQALGRAEADLDARRRARAEERMQRENAAFQTRMEHIHAEAEQFAQYGGQIADIFIQASHTQGDFGKAVAAGFRSELEGLGKTELIKGLSDEAEAIGLAFVNPPAAGAKAISGAQHLAVSALAFGGSAIAGAAAGSGSAAGGGGSTPSRPLHSGGGSGGSGGDTYTFNILGPMITESGKAALGRTLDDITRAARRRLGTRADGTST